jgi:hypothetical protein
VRRIELALANKADLAKVGAVKKVDAGKAARGKQLGVLSPNDNTPVQPKHDTRADIASKANVSTGQVGMAEVVRREAPCTVSACRRVVGARKVGCQSMRRRWGRVRRLFVKSAKPQRLQKTS